MPGELGQLARKDLIRLAAASLVAGGIAYRFKHILVREAAYRGTAKRLRADLHERFADWLERVAGERVAEYHEILGYHFEQAYRYREELGAVDADAQLLAARAGAPPRRRGPARERPRRRRRRREPARTLRRRSCRSTASSGSSCSPARLRGRPDRADARGAGDRPGAVRARNARSASARSRPTAGRTRRRTRSSTARRTRRGRGRVQELIERLHRARRPAGLAQATRRLALVHRTEGQRGLAIEWLEKALRARARLRRHVDAPRRRRTRSRTICRSARSRSARRSTVSRRLLETCRRRPRARGGDPAPPFGAARDGGALRRVARVPSGKAGPMLDDAGVESLSWGSLGLGGVREPARRATARAPSATSRRSGASTRSRTARRSGSRSAPPYNLANLLLRRGPLGRGRGDPRPVRRWRPTGSTRRSWRRA